MLEAFLYSVLLCFKVDANAVSVGPRNIPLFHHWIALYLQVSNWMHKTVGSPCGPWFRTNICSQLTVIASKISKAAMPNPPLPV